MKCHMCSHYPGQRCYLYANISCTCCNRELQPLNGKVGIYIGKIDGQHRFSFTEPFTCHYCNTNITKVQFWCDGEALIWDVSQVNQEMDNPLNW